MNLRFLGFDSKGTEYSQSRSWPNLSSPKARYTIQKLTIKLIAEMLEINIMKYSDTFTIVRGHQLKHNILIQHLIKI